MRKLVAELKHEKEELYMELEAKEQLLDSTLYQKEVLVRMVTDIRSAASRITAIVSTSPSPPRRTRPRSSVRFARKVVRKTEVCRR